MADYFINSDKGKELANRLQAGDMAEASDGSLWKKEADGSITVTKNGQTMTGRVGVSAPAAPATPEYTPEQPASINTPVLDSTNQAAPSSSMQQDTTRNAITPEQTEQVLASEKARQATDAVTAGLTQDGEKAKISNEQLNDAVQQALQPEYRIGSAKGVSLSEKLQRAGDMAEASDGSLWTRNEDGSITVKKDGKTYTATIDREAAKRDAQQAAAPASPGTGSAGGSYSGGSGTYASSTSGTKKSAAKSAPASTGPDVATLRKKAASAQKDMADIARQISANKARGKSSGDLESKYAEAKSRYDTARAQINAASAELTLVKQATAPEIKAAAASGQNARDSYSVQYTDTPSRAEVKRSYQERKEEAKKEARKNAWKSLPTVADADRFTINEAADAQTRGAEQQLFDSVRRELQQNAWRSLPTVRDSERFRIPSQTDSLIQQAITQRQSAAQPQTDKGIGGKLFTMLGAGLGQFNSSIANFADAAATTVETVESYLNGGFTKDGKFVKGDSAFTSSLLQPIHAWAKYTQRTSDSLNKRSAANWSDTKAGGVANTIGTGVIAALPQAALALLTLGTSSAGTLTQASSGLAGSIEAVMRRISSDPSYWLSFMQETGGNFAEAKGAGATDEQAILASTIAGLANAAIEVGGGLENNDWMNDGTLSALSKAKNLIKGAAEEGGEELIQNPISRAMQKLVYDGDREWLSLDNTAQGRDAVFNPYQSAEEFATGAAVGGILGAGNFALNRALGSRSQNQTQNTQPTQDEMLDASIQAALRGETLTAPAQAANQNAQQTTQPAQERGAEGVITGEEANKNPAAPEQTTVSPINGPVRSDAAEAGAININDGAEKIKSEFIKLIEKNNGSISVNQLVDYGSSLSKADAQALISFLDDIDSGKTPYKYDARSGIHKVDPNSHIDNRDMSMRMKRGQHSFQYDNPEIHKYMKDAAQSLLEEIHNSTRGERLATPVEDGDNGGYYHWTGTKRHTTDGIAYLKDNFGISWDNLAKAAEAIIKDDGAENYADALRVEMLLDDMLTHGYQSLTNQNEFHSYSIPPNEAYIAAKSAIPGASGQYKQESDMMDLLFEEMDNAESARKIQENAESSVGAYTIRQNENGTYDLYTPDGIRLIHDASKAYVEKIAKPLNREITKNQSTWGIKVENVPTAESSGSVNQNISPNDMGAMRSQFESVPKQSQTQSNTINSMETGWDVPEAQRTPIMYDTISEAKSLDNARLRLAQDYAGEMAELRGKHNWSGEEVDMSMTILDNYRRAAEQTGDWTEYSNWRKEFSAHGTAAGQALQAYAKYSRQTGGGIVADASAALERAAKKTNKAEIMNRVSALAQQYDAAVGTGQENAKVNVNDLLDIIKSASTVRQTGTLIGNKTSPIVNWAMNRIANYARAEAQSGGGKNLDFLKTFAADSIYNIAADTRTVSAGEKVKTVRRAGMLSKVATFMRNLVSNNVFDPVDSVARNISVPLDMLVSTITGTRSVAGDASWFSAAKRKGSMDGLARACMEVGLDVDTSGGAGKYENTANRTFKMSGGVFSKLMSVWEAYEGYTLNATDEFQKGGIEASVQHGIDRLYEKGKIKDDSLRDAGKQEALYRTFQDKNVLSDAAIGIRNALNKAHIGDIGAGDIVLPFAQVPSNLGARAIEYSPAGLLVSTADFINMLDSAKKGNLTAAQQAKAVQGVGRALTGSGMIAIAAAGALRGWLKVTGDDEDKNKDALGKTHGLDGTQLNISAALRDLRGESAEWQHGDTLLSIGFLDPLNAQLTTGALIADDIRSEAGVTAGRVLGNSLSGALQSVLDTPVMSAMQDVVNNYQYSDASTPGGKMLDAAQKYAANQLSSVIPNALRGIAQGLDDTERNAYSSDNVWQQAVDNAKASIPGLRETLPAKTDVWGNPVKNEGGVRNFMNRNINPGNITTYKTDAVSSEIEKISDATGNSLYPDRTAPRSVKVDGESVSLTFEQRSIYQKAYGDAYSASVTALMNDKNYKSMPDSMKAEILKQAKDVAAESAKDKLGIGYEMKASAQKILEKSGAERNNAMISAAVKAQHYLSDDTKKQLSGVENQYKGADYIGLSNELVNSAKDKANEYFTAVEASKYGGKLTDTQKSLSGKSSEELAQYFMEKTIENRYSDTNKNGTKADEYLAAYKNGEINDAVALAVLSDKEIKAYDRYGRNAKVTPTMALQAANAHAGMKDVKDEDGKVTESAESQFDAWLDKQKWTEDQKSAIRMGFYTDNTKTYTYLSEQLRKGNISTSSAKSELSPSYQAGWSHNVKDTGAEMADYIDAIVEYEERPNEDERKAAGYKNAWTWFCDYLNSTDLTQEQKYAIAISMYDYGDSTKKKIWDRLR